MSASDQNLFLIGVVLAVTVYAFYKFLQFRKRRKEKTASIEPPASAEVETVTSAASKEVSEESIATESVETSIPLEKTPLIAWTAEPGKEKEASPFDPIEEEYPYFDQGDYVFGGLTPALAAMLPATEKTRSTLTRALRNAGFYSPHAWHNLSALRYLCMMLPLIACGFLLAIVPEQLEFTVIIALIVTTSFGWALPSLYVRSKATDRLREISNGIPDMLDLLNMCVSQGMTVTSGLGRIGRDIAPVYPALSKELKIVTDQAKIGPLPQALSAFSQRVNIPEVNSFTSLLIQTERMGTSVSEALAEYSDNMRESMKQRADEKANSATFKMLFPTVMCLMPAVFLFLLGPTIVELNRFYEDGAMDAFNIEIPDRFVEDQ